MIVVLTLLTMRARKRWRKEDTQRARRAFLVLLIALMVTLASTAVFSYLAFFQPRKYEYTYGLTLTAEDDVAGVVLLPVTVLEELRDRIRVRSGDGNASIVGTEHGLALRLEFQGDVVVRGHIISDRYFKEWGPTLLDEDDERYAWVKLDGFNRTVSMVLDLDYHIVTTTHGYRMREGLVTGWNLYPIWDYTILA